MSSARFGADFEKANKIVIELQRQLDARDDPDQFLRKICDFLKDEKDDTLSSIADKILSKLEAIIQSL